MSEPTDEKKEEAGEKEPEGEVKEEKKAEAASPEKAEEKPKKAPAKKTEKPAEKEEKAKKEEKAEKEAAEPKEEKPVEKDAAKPEKEQKEKPIEKAKDGGKGKMTKEDVISYIESMSVLELSEMIKELQDKFGVTAAPVAAAAVAAPAAGGEAAAEEKTEFDVVLSAAGDKKIQVIKEVRAITGLSLKEAKDLVDGAPKPVKEKASQEEANKIKEQLEGAGATVELK